MQTVHVTQVTGCLCWSVYFPRILLTSGDQEHIPQDAINYPCIHMHTPLPRHTLYNPHTPIPRLTANQPPQPPVKQRYVTESGRQSGGREGDTNFRMMSPALQCQSHTLPHYIKH